VIKPTLSFIGAGKVGQTLARLWYEMGYEIAAVYSRTMQSAETLASAVNTTVAASLDEVVSSADFIFLTIPDDAIELVAMELASLDLHDKSVVHTSGASSLDKLEVLQNAGAQVGSLHPAFPFADVETSMRVLPGSAFATEASHEGLQTQLSQLVSAINGIEIRIPKGGKARYHAALVMASNYTVTLYSVAERLLASLGAEKEASAQALNAIVSATVNNLVEVGTPWALTGPLTRADVGTIQAHLDSIDDDDIRAAYLHLAQLTIPMLQARDVPLAEIETILQENL